MSITSFVKRIQDITRNDAGVNGDAQRIEQMSWLLFLKIYDSREMVWELEEDEYESIIPEELKWRNWAHAQNGERVLTGDELLDFVNNKLFKELKELEITSIMPIRKTIVKSAFEDANNYMKNGVLLRQVINVIDEVDFNPNFKLKLATQKKFTWRLVVQAFFRVVVNPIFDKSYFFRSRFLGSFR
ncbi:type I restriction-modification system M protein [Streptococcus pneumoniae]|nr:type I restriction-modification system M protein [Streptococcus pneumoniae]